MTDRLVWERDGLDWPHHGQSQFINAAGLRWHVQQFGAPTPQLPVAMLIHGTGASTHSWRGLAPLLAPHFNVMSMDLPGHGFTDTPVGGATSPQFSLPGMARAIHTLLLELGMEPSLVVGHSAGAAIAVRMCLDQLIAPRSVIALNGAFLPLGGLAGQVFSPVARLMAATSLVPMLFSWRAAEPKVLQKLIEGTGSTLDASGVALYRKLVSTPAHAAGALAMMGNWDLPSLLRDLPKLRTPLCLMAGSNDLTISPRQASRVMAMLPSATRASLISLQGLGHLAHEENPALIADEILKHEA